MADFTKVQEDRSRPQDLAKAIRKRIAHRTRVRIRTLEFEVAGDRVIVSGHVSSYYLKQLVLQSVLDVVGAADVSRIEFNVQVAATSPKSVERID